MVCIILIMRSTAPLTWKLSFFLPKLIIKLQLSISWSNYLPIDSIILLSEFEFFRNTSRITAVQLESSHFVNLRLESVPLREDRRMIFNISAKNKQNGPCFLSIFFLSSMVLFSLCPKPRKSYFYFGYFSFRSKIMQ